MLYYSSSKPKRNFLCPSLWDDVDVEVVSSLPEAIDGHRKFNVLCEPDNLMKSTKDGRPWGPYMSSSRQGVGIRRIANCKGGHTCHNLRCPFLEQFKTVNKVQFLKMGAITVCRCCSEPAQHVQCHAIKIWEFMAGNMSREVMVYHEGIHTCTATVKKTEISKETLDGLNEKTVNRTRVDSIKKLLDNESSWEAIDNIATEVQDRKRLANQQQSLKKSKPDGHSFDAVITLKSYTDKKDPFFIYTINNMRMNNGMPTYVFKTSRAAVQLAMEMDKDNHGFMSEEFCFLDAKHDRYVSYAVYRTKPVVYC